MATPEEILGGVLGDVANAAIGQSSAPAEIARANYLNSIRQQGEMDAIRERARLQGQNELAVAQLREGGDNTRHQATITVQREIAAGREAGDNTRTEANNKAALERTKEQIKGYVDRLSEAEKLREVQHIAAFATPRRPEESVDDYLVRAGAEAAENVAGVLDRHDSQLSDIEKRVDVVRQAEQARQTKLAEAMTAAQFNKVLTTQDPKVQTAILARMQTGLTPSEAIDRALKDKTIKADIGTQLKSSYDEAAQTAQAAATARPSTEYLSAIDKLSRTANLLTAKREDLIKAVGGLGARAEFLRNQRKNGKGLSIDLGEDGGEGDGESLKATNTDSKAAARMIGMGDLKAAEADMKPAAPPAGASVYGGFGLPRSAASPASVIAPPTQQFGIQQPAMSFRQPVTAMGMPMPSQQPTPEQLYMMRRNQLSVPSAPAPRFVSPAQVIGAGSSSAVQVLPDGTVVNPLPAYAPRRAEDVFTVPSTAFAPYTNSLSMPVYPPSAE